MSCRTTPHSVVDTALKSSLQLLQAQTAIAVYDCAASANSSFPMFSSYTGQICLACCISGRGAVVCDAAGKAVTCVMSSLHLFIRTLPNGPDGIIRVCVCVHHLAGHCCDFVQVWLTGPTAGTPYYKGMEWEGLHELQLPAAPVLQLSWMQVASKPWCLLCLRMTLKHNVLQLLL